MKIFGFGIIFFSEIRKYKLIDCQAGGTDIDHKALEGYTNWCGRWKMYISYKQSALGTILKYLCSLYNNQQIPLKKPLW